MDVYTRESEKMERINSALSAYAETARLENPEDTEITLWHLLRDLISTYSDLPQILADATEDWKQLG